MCIVKDKGLAFDEWVGGDVGVRGRSDALVSRPCLDVDLFSDEELTPLRFYLVVSNKRTTGPLPSS